MTQFQLTDDQILDEIDRQAQESGWDTAALLIDTVTESTGLPRERVKAVYTARLLSGGAG